MKTRKQFSPIHRGRTILGLAVTLLAGSLAGHTTEWTRFRGPNGQGQAPDADPPVEWSAEKNVRWRTALPGPGSSSPVLTGRRLFLTASTASEGKTDGLPDQKHLLCYDTESGRLLWDHKVPVSPNEDLPRGFITQHGYASNTPVTDGKRVFAFFGKSGMVACDLEGHALWKRDLGQESSNRHWGSAASPILWKDLVIVNAAEESRTVYALEQATGKIRWQAPGEALELCYGTPVLVPRTDGTPDVVLAMPGEIWGLNPTSGKLRWLAENGLPGNVCPSVVVGNHRVFAFGGFPRLGAVAVKTGGKGDVTQTHVLWRGSDSTYVPTPVLHDDHLYFASDQGFAVCLEAATGKTVFKKRLPDIVGGGRGAKPVYASPVLAGGRIYVLSRQRGAYVMAATPEFKLLAHNPPLDESQFNATPAPAGNRLYLRSDTTLYCLE